MQLPAGQCAKSGPATEQVIHSRSFPALHADVPVIERVGSSRTTRLLECPRLWVPSPWGHAAALQAQGCAISLRHLG